VKRTATFDAITRLLSDGAWHAVDDLRDVTGWPVEWVDELAAEGLVDTREQIGHTLVRLRPREPAAVS
jgi:hypothetical protein